MSQAALHRLLYASRASARTLANLQETVTEVLAVSQVNNARVNVTGLLLVHGGWFVQALEGSRVAVASVFKRVSDDSRHSQIKVISSEPAKERLFGEWSMCAKTLSTADDEILDVLSLRAEFDIQKATPQAVLKLLTTIKGIQAKAA